MSVLGVPAPVLEEGLWSWPQGWTGLGHGAACTPGPSGAFRRFQVSCRPLPTASLVLSLKLCDWEHPSCPGCPVCPPVSCPWLQGSYPSPTTQQLGVGARPLPV